MEITKHEYKRSSFLNFALTYGVKNVGRETARILLRTIKELSPNYIILAKNETGRVFGYGTIRKIPAKYDFAPDGGGIIGPFFVEECYRKCGIGTEILLELEKIATDKRFHKVYAYVLTQNIGSRKAFQKSGYSMIEYMVSRLGKFYLCDAGDFCVYCKELK